MGRTTVEYLDGCMAPQSSAIPAANVSSVPQRSPLRYPGGKTWLIPHIREWLGAPPRPPLVIEPFGGGGTASLTAVMENLAGRALMIDLDRDVSAFWRASLRHTDEMIERVLAFKPTRSGIESVCGDPSTVVDHGFRTLVLNRTRRGGVLAPRASLIRNGENHKGVASRWYPETLAERLRTIGEHAGRISFYEGDGVAMLELLAGLSDARFFIDPPYTAHGGKRAGSRLYVHSDVDHARIFKALGESDCDFLMTMDCSSEILQLVAEHSFSAAAIMMRNSHHSQVEELLITRAPMFTRSETP